MNRSSFDQEDAVHLNQARKDFLDTFLREMIQAEAIRTTLDVGCGYGFFAEYLGGLGLEVTGLDARRKNVVEATRRHPGIRFTVGDVEDGTVPALGSFDLIFCFGLLYHLENPFRAVRGLFHATRKYLLLESAVFPSPSPVAVFYEEPPADNQSLEYVAWVPTELAIVKMLYKAGFASVYAPTRRPAHGQFRHSLIRRRMRTILLASKEGKGAARRWGGIDFKMVPEPRECIVTETAWDTTLGRITRSLVEPKRLVRVVFERACRVLPSWLGLKICGRLSMPVRQRHWPGWKLGVRRSRWYPSVLIREALWRWFSLTHPGRFFLHWHDGLRVVAYPEDEASRALFLTGCFEPNELSYLARMLKPGMTVIDAGAHLGLYTLFAARAVGDGGIVVAVEPSSREFHRLKANLELNGIRNVRLRREALSNAHAQAELLIAHEDHSEHNTLGEFAYEFTRCLRKESVVTERLDEIVRQERLSALHVMKMDLEGSELFALQGAHDVLRRFHPLLLVELSDRALQHQGCHSAQVWALLLSLGYRIYRFDRATGELAPGHQEDWFEGENVVAIHEGAGS